ncbi:amidohydrolase [Sphingobacterium lumbrici]|uniref:amidohydrolase n=1 Tax=Sphingobacterium lumbrici TaxID=2559600 RepID=UPI001126EAC2|nr:amidohydrolase [Sphingobacterium lumbrici]
MTFVNRIFPILLLIGLFSSCTTNTEVDLIVFNAKIYTVDSTFTTAEAFAVKNGIFIDIGTSEVILKRYKAKGTIDAKGHPIYPGFYDAHAHFFMFAELLDQADLTGATSVGEVIEKLKIYHLSHPKKKWIIGSGWDQNLWPDNLFPTKDSLDKYFPDIPIYLSRIDHHAAWINSKALEIAGLDSGKTVEGGLIMLDSLGHPSGILMDNATSLVFKHIPDATDINLLTSLRRVQDSLFSVGLTSIVDAGLNPDQLEILTKFYSQDSLKIRNYAMILANPYDIENYIRQGIYDSDRLSIKSVKLITDGALGSRGAYLLEHYHNHPSKGFLLQSPTEFDEIIQLLANSPFQVNTHTIGDSTDLLILDAYSRHLKDGKNRRWRIEHAQVIAPDDFKKFSKFHIIPSIQPTHATSDMYRTEEHVDTERIKGTYPYKQLLRQYGLVVLGSDFPMKHFNPLYGYHAAVARVDKTGFPGGGFQMENALTREEALRGMTIWAAFSCFQEQKRGSIEKGKDADFVILEDDIMSAPDNQLRDIKTLRTVIAGETVFLRQ